MPEIVRGLSLGTGDSFGSKHLGLLKSRFAGHPKLILFGLYVHLEHVDADKAVFVA